MQRYWRSLHSLGALVITVVVDLLITHSYGDVMHRMSDVMQAVSKQLIGRKHRSSPIDTVSGGLHFAPGN